MKMVTENGNSLPYRKRVLVIEIDNLLSDAVSSLLAKHADFDVKFITLNALADLDHKLRFDPDVIIIEKSQWEANLAQLLNLSDQYPRMRLIVLGWGGNDLCVYDKNIVQVNQISDFFQLL